MIVNLAIREGMWEKRGSWVTNESLLVKPTSLPLDYWIKGIENSSSLKLLLKNKEVKLFFLVIKFQTEYITPKRQL